MFKISPEVALPPEIAGRRTAVFGISGSGKSNTATVVIENLADAGEQFVLIDPKGEGWGLLSLANGKAVPRQVTSFSKAGEVMPMNRALYPDDWDDIATAIKEAAGWRCEHCGKQCRRPDEPFDTHKRTATVAHLNHCEADCRPENLACLCAPCHLAYDAPHKRLTRRVAKRIKRLASEPLFQPGATHV